MQRSGPYLILFALAMVFGGSLLARGPDGVRASDAQQGTLDDYVYLPLVTSGMTNAQPRTVDLIDEAVAQGEINAETGLIYKVFAVFNDPRLPAKYVGAIGREADGIIIDVLAENGAGTLSPEAIATLTPFFIPPGQPGSWYELQHHLQTSETVGVQAAPVPEWDSMPAVDGKVTIFWPKGNAMGEDKAWDLKVALDNVIWRELTTLMGAEPQAEFSSTPIYLWDHYIEGGVIVPFGADTAGIILRDRCSETAGVIYLPINQPVGSATQPGLLQFATHELMHAIQFALPTPGACSDYEWLAEATATWAEDYVYPKANSERSVGTHYLDYIDKRLDYLGSDSNLHEYGAYQLFYYLSHTVDPSAAVVRRTWENAMTTSNSYLAFKNAVPAEKQDEFWGDYLLTLWNQAPFEEYYKEKDGVTWTVKAQLPDPVEVKAGAEPFIYELKGALASGGARFYHFTFPDASVRTLSILNGLEFELRKDVVTQEYSSQYTTPQDRTYRSSELSEADAAGATLVGMIKIAGEDTWRRLSLAGHDQYSYCVDMDGPIEEMVLVQSNADWEHPDRTMTVKELPTTVYATNIPCYQYRGTASVTEHVGDVSYTYTASNLIYGDSPNFQQPGNLNRGFPLTLFYLLSGTVHWEVSGTEGGCTYSGSGSYPVSYQEGSLPNQLTVYHGILTDGPSHRGYAGWSGTAEQFIKYTVACPGFDPHQEERWAPPFQNLLEALDANRATQKIALDGVLSGTYDKECDPGHYDHYEWELRPQTK